MSVFYLITNDTPSVEANNAKEASRFYALQSRITSGKVTVVTNTKTFDMTEIPPDIQATEVT